MPRFVQITLWITLVLLLSACTRSVSSSALPTATQDTLSALFSTIATETALANSAKNPDAVLTPDDSAPAASPTAPFGATATLELSPTPEATATNTPAPISEQSVPSSYTLRQGEWPYCLARRFNIDPAAILSANGLSESQAANLSVGTTLTIPVAQVGTYGPGRQLRAHPATYVASSTDTFYSIACAFGDVWPQNIAEANGLTLDSALQPGMNLHIP
ncbi:MAG: LysM peptidoglycan-binding domain-containing protein [Anaerolineales bacterium]|nr:LysM peptidoglycan-binding domain-containing protein [Anaerolineales bacterium]